MILAIVIACVQIGLMLQAAKNLKLFRHLTSTSKEGIDTAISVCLPMRNEIANVERILSELLRERSLIEEIIILNDESTDGTSEVLARFKGLHPSLITIIAGRPKPMDWAGKVWALSQLVSSARNERLIFIDADVHLQPEAIGALLQEVASTGTDHLSIFPTQITTSSTDLLVNHIYTTLLHLLPMQFVSDARYPAAVAGCGQVQFVTKQMLARIGGLEAIKSTLHDGLQLARGTKRVGGRASFAAGGEFIRCEMYGSFAEAWRGFRRNAFEATGGILPLILTTTILLLAFVAGPLMILRISLSSMLLIVPTLLLYRNYSGIIRSFGLRRSFLYRLPISVLLFTLLQWSSYLRNLLGIRSTWRGRKV